MHFSSEGKYLRLSCTVYVPIVAVASIMAITAEYSGNFNELLDHS